MANELIVDFPKRSDKRRRPRNRDGNNIHGHGHGHGHGGSRGRGRSRPHPASYRRRSHSYDFHCYWQSHRHDQLLLKKLMRHEKTSNRSDRYHRSRSKSCNQDYYYDSSSSSSRDRSSLNHRTTRLSSLTTRSVQFADTSLLYFVTKHEERQDVHRCDLWYTQADIDLMKLAAREDVVKVREQISAGIFIDDLDENNDDASEESSSYRRICCMGLESRLTQARVKAVKTCKARCVRAVLKEQERQKMKMMDLSSSSSSPTSAMLVWDMIALTSFSQTMRAALRARKLGILHEHSMLKFAGKNT